MRKISLFLTLLCSLMALNVSAKEYALRVKNQVVTDANKDDILGDGTMSFVIKEEGYFSNKYLTYTLVLNGLNMTESYQDGLKAFIENDIENLTIQCNGDNQIMAHYAIITSQDMTIKGDNLTIIFEWNGVQLGGDQAKLKTDLKKLHMICPDEHNVSDGFTKTLGHPYRHNGIVDFNNDLDLLIKAYSPAYNLYIISTPWKAMFIDEKGNELHYGTNDKGATFFLRYDSDKGDYVEPYECAKVVKLKQLNEYTITGDCDPEAGTVSLSGYYNTYLEGRSVTATFKPNPEYTFVKWSNGATENPYTFKASQDLHLTAIARHEQYFDLNLSANNDAYGTVSGAGRYILNSEQVIEAKAKAGYVFSNWSDGSYDAKRTIKMTKNFNLKANFVAEGTATEYGIEIFGHKVTSANAADVLGNGTITYDAATSTLTLNNANLESSSDTYYGAGISVDGQEEVTIQLNGTNRIACLNNCIEVGNTLTQTELYIYGPGTLNMDSENGSAIFLNSKSYVYIQKNAYLDIYRGTIRGGDEDATALYVSNSTVYIGGDNWEAEHYTAISGVKWVSLSGVSMFPTSCKYNDTEHCMTKKTGNTQYFEDVLIAPGNPDIRNYSYYTLTLENATPEAGELIGGGKFRCRTEVEIEAILLRDDYEFVGWKHHDAIGNTPFSSKDAKTTYKMEAHNETLVATFAPKAEAVGAFVHICSAVNVGGTVVPEINDWYPEGTVLNVEAVADEGYNFIGWSDGEKEAARSVTVGTEEIVLRALFAKPTSEDTALPNVEAATEVNKLLLDGELIIERAGHRYNAQGAER